MKKNLSLAPRITRECVRQYSGRVRDPTRRVDLANDEAVREAIRGDLAIAIPIDPVCHWRLAELWGSSPYMRYFRVFDWVYAVSERVGRGSVVGVRRIDLSARDIGYHLTEHCVIRFAERVFGRTEARALRELGARIRSTIIADLIQAERLEPSESAVFSRYGVDPAQEHHRIQNRIYAVWHGTIVKTMLVADNANEEVIESFRRSVDNLGRSQPEDSSTKAIPLKSGRKGKTRHRKGAAA